MEISFQLEATTNHIKVPVYVNKHGPFMFTLDTGAIATTISKTLAEKLQIPTFSSPNKRKFHVGISAHEARLNHFQLGSKIFQDEDVLVIDFGQRLSGCVNNIGGVIGHSTLKYFKVAIDYRNNRLKLIESHNTQDEDQDSFYWGSFEYVNDTHLVGVPVKINDHGPFPFVLDTGAGGSIITPHLAKHLELSLDNFDGECRGIGGGTQGYLTEIKHLSVNDAQLDNQPVLVIDLHAITPKAELISNGILGYPFLKHFEVIIDYPNKKVAFKKT